MSIQLARYLLEYRLVGPHGFQGFSHRRPSFNGRKHAIKLIDLDSGCLKMIPHEIDGRAC